MKSFVIDPNLELEEKNVKKSFALCWLAYMYKFATLSGNNDLITCKLEAQVVVSQGS